MMRVVAAIIAGLALVACGTFKHVDRDDVSRPESTMGTGARVILPGERGPGMSGGTRQSDGTSSSDPEGDLTMIGGHAQEGSTSTRKRQLPILGPLGVLFGYPFWIFGKSLEEKAAEAAEAQRSEQAAPGKTPDGIERDRVLRENERIEQELGERSRRTTSGAGSQARRASVAEEIAHLERELGAGASGTSPPLGDAWASGTRSLAAIGAPRETVDRNGDGQPDLWAYYDGTRLVREVLDEDQNGQADRILHYEGGRRLTRVEEDLDGDGRLETVSIYREGRVARKRADEDGDGQADSWSFYRAGELLRHELDRNHDGFRDLVMIYEAGELRREEEDRNGDGRPDLLALYRDGEVTERHEDIDYDGTPDVTSYYEGGKLVRRELNSSETLETWSGPGSP